MEGLLSVADKHYGCRFKKFE